MENNRELIVQMLLQIEKEETFVNLLLRDVLDKYDYLSMQEKAFIKRVTQGTVERKIQLDYVIDAYSNTPVRKMKPFIRCLMRMSTYQLLFMDSIPDSAVCNEAVKLATRHKFASLKGFVNGVLRQIARNKDHIVYPDPQKDWCRYLEVMYSMPAELIKLWQDAYGREITTEIVQGLMEIRPVSLRMNRSYTQTSWEKVAADIAGAGADIRKNTRLDYAYALEKSESLSALPGYEQGMFQVQDVSSMCVTQAAGLAPGMNCLDVCASPGGKAIHTAEVVGDHGSVEARDLTQAKVMLLEENIERMKRTNIRAKVWDATVFDETAVEQYDVVFADVPCSGLGIMAKKQDIKYHVTPQGLDSLCELQRQILDTVWQYVKPGGEFVYSTCTIRPEENEQMVEWFTMHYPFEKVSMEDTLGEVFPEEKEALASGCIQLIPGRYDTDGFFIARLKRK